MEQAGPSQVSALLPRFTVHGAICRSAAAATRPGCAAGGQRARTAALPRRLQAADVSEQAQAEALQEQLLRAKYGGLLPKKKLVPKDNRCGGAEAARGH
jgi:hypothetical protein